MDQDKVHVLRSSCAAPGSHPLTFQRTETIYDLDSKYRGAIHASELVTKDDEARRLNVQILLLRDDNATLKDEIVNKQTQIKQSAAQCDDLSVQLDTAHDKCRGLESKLRLQAREKSALKVPYPSPDDVAGILCLIGRYTD